MYCHLAIDLRCDGYTRQQNKNKSALFHGDYLRWDQSPPKGRSYSFGSGKSTWIKPETYKAPKSFAVGKPYCPRKVRFH
jgi:hypothetical protein